MKPLPALILSHAFAHLVLAAAARAEVIASTTFDDRTVSENTASGLNWSTNGVADPGDMSSLVFEGGAVNLFDNTPDNQDSFVPALNTGNGNTSWTTTVNLTALAGTSVTVEEITFDYLAVSAAGVINVSRRSDFTVTLFNPSSEAVATASITEALSGTNVDPMIAPVTLTLDTPITLSLPGTYTLVIRGGDFLQDDETGNHTGIDNLAINGTIGGGAGLAVTAINYDPATGSLSLTWNSSPGQAYLLKYSSDLVDWDSSLGARVGDADRESTTATFDLNDLSLQTERKLFFRVEVE